MATWLTENRYGDVRRFVFKDNNTVHVSCYNVLYFRQMKIDETSYSMVDPDGGPYIQVGHVLDTSIGKRTIKEIKNIETIKNTTHELATPFTLHFVLVLNDYL